MRSLFGNLHPTSSFQPLTGQAKRPVTSGATWIWAVMCLVAGAVQAASLAWPAEVWAWPGTSPGQPNGLWQILSIALFALAL
ncbi:MAG: hypothetical protein WEK74_05325, partial [Hydrogenophaga sp.]